MTSEVLMACALLIPFASAVLIAITGRIPNLREGVTLLSAVSLFAVVIQLLLRVLDGERPELQVIAVFPQVEVNFVLEPLGMIFALVASTLWIVNSVYSVGYMRGNNEPRQTPFYVCFAVAIAGAMGVAMAGNLLTLFLYYELLTLSTYPLVTHKGTEDAKKAGRTYLVLLIGTSMCLLLPAIIWVFAAAGTTDFTTGGLLAGTDLTPLAIGVLLALCIFGIGKAAVMPVHFWLPAAMVAPTPVSALLHAVAVVKAGVFTVVKVIVYIFGVDHLAESGAGEWLTYAAGFTVIAASIVALMQDNLKKRLAFSTVSQLSYVVLAAAILTPISVIGAALAHCGPCGFQDHPLLRGRLDLYCCSQIGDQPARRYRPQDALDHGCLHNRRAEHDRRTADSRLREQVVHALGRVHSGKLGRARGDLSLHGAECLLLPARDLARLFPRTGTSSTRSTTTARPRGPSCWRLRRRLSALWRCSSCLDCR